MISLQTRWDSWPRASRLSWKKKDLSTKTATTQAPVKYGHKTSKTRKETEKHANRDWAVFPFSLQNVFSSFLQCPNQYRARQSELSSFVQQLEANTALDMKQKMGYVKTKLMTNRISNNINGTEIVSVNDALSKHKAQPNVVHRNPCEEQSPAPQNWNPIFFFGGGGATIILHATKKNIWRNS